MSEPTEAEKKQLAEIQRNVAEPIRVVVGTMVRGLFVALSEAPANVVANMIAWQVANHLGNAFAADDLGTLFALRGDMKKAFEDGIAKAKISPRPGQAAGKLDG